MLLLINKIKPFVVATILLFATSNSFGQVYGNEWINYNNTYLKFPVITTGAYRINYDVLKNSLAAIGVDIQTINAKNISIYGRGQEIPLYVYGENDNSLDSGDYIEFFAQKNDGWFDNKLYNNDLQHTNPYYSNFTDTAYYFLTWNNSAGLRFRIETDTNFSMYNPHSHIFVERILSFNSYYNPGRYNKALGISLYKTAEGWMDGGIKLGNSSTKSIPTSNRYAIYPTATIEYAVAGTNSPTYPHHLQVEIGNEILTDTTCVGQYYMRVKKEVPTSFFGPNTTPLVFRSINDKGNTTSYQSVVYIKLKYAHTFSLESGSSYSFSANNLAGAKALFSFTSYTIGTQSDDEVFLLDLTNNLRIKAIKQGYNIKALVPNYNNEINCFLTSTAATNIVPTLVPVNKTGKFTNPQNFYNTDFFIVTHKNFISQCQDYANYRNRLSPCKYHAFVFDVGELYDMFAYGIRNNPIAIHNLIKYAYETFDTLPKYLFLVGRAYTSSAGRKNAARFNETYVPTMGSVPSDFAITMGLGDTVHNLCLPTGRLSTSTNQHISWYLDKIRTYEAAQQTPQAWMKQILHFGGGFSAIEQQTFASYLEHCRQIAEGPAFGAKVSTFLKVSSDPIEINLSDSLRHLINNGVQIMTFFGHAGGTGFDVSVDDPENYNNDGKYFVVLGNGCYAGNIFEGKDNYSEAFINIPNKGAIAYLSPASTGSSSMLFHTSRHLYTEFANNSYGESLGFCLQKAMKSVTDAYGKENMDYVLHGDPSIKLSPIPKPDFDITNSDVSTIPDFVRTDADSFDVVAHFSNLGKVTLDSFLVIAERFYPNGTSEKLNKRVVCQSFSTEVRFRFAVKKSLSLGQNRIVISLDALNEIDEVNKNNNTASISFNIVSSDVLASFPYKYAIVPNNEISLIATSNIEKGEHFVCLFEIDTCNSFNSPLKTQTEIPNNTGIIEWKLPFSLTDSTVYYWRVCNKDKDTIIWNESSFQYIAGKTGVSQAHFYQMEDNTYYNANISRQNRSINFQQGYYAFLVKTRFFASLSEEAQYEQEVYVRRNNVGLDIIECVMGNRPYIQLLVFNPITGDNWKNEETTQWTSIGKYGQSICRNYVTNSFSFYMDNATDRANVAKLLQDIPNGYYVLIYSVNNPGAQWFTEEEYQAWESIGSSQIRNLTASNDYIIWGRKGANIGDAGIREAVGTNNGQFLTLAFEMQVPLGNAKIVTPNFGPAKNWQSFHWQALLADTSDSVSVNIYGVNNMGQSTLLVENLTYPDNKDYFDLSSKIDAQQFPYVYLEISLQDNVSRTSPQLKHLLLMYEDIPDIAVCLDNYFFHTDTVLQGDNIRLSISAKNISQKDMDSLTVRYHIIQQNQIIDAINKDLPSPLQANNLITDTITISTKNYQGGHFLIKTEFNPEHKPIEKYYHNNYHETPFFVTKDTVNPLLDVTFDGTHIIDGELVSAKPYIQIVLKDENKFLFLDNIEDTANFKIYLKSPRSTIYKYVPFFANGKEVMQFVPANSKNKCQVNYPAVFEEDGTYTLRVEATDKTNNPSGKNAFVVNFEVQNKSTITEVYNYPNPFSTHTQFVFTLTGSELPTFMKIQIMTISGKVVKEIDMSEIGNLRIGKNITSYSWDGRDNNGDLLANGVYLYRVITKIDNQNIELNSQSNNAKAFKNGFGKMVIIR